MNNNQGKDNSSPTPITPQGSGPSTQIGQPTQVVHQSAGKRETDFQNICFLPPTDNATKDIPNLMVVGAYAVAINPPHQHGNRWFLYLTCLPLVHGKIPSTVGSTALLKRVRICAFPDYSRPTPRGGYYARTDVVVLGYNATSSFEVVSVVRKRLPIWDPPGAHSPPGSRSVLDCSFPVRDVLAVMGSIVLDTYGFDRSGGGSHNWFWILVCALGKYGKLKVTQERWDMLLDIVWTKWPERSLYNPDSPHPGDSDAGPNWTPSVRQGVINRASEETVLRIIFDNWRAGFNLN